MRLGHQFVAGPTVSVHIRCFCLHVQRTLTPLHLVVHMSTCAWPCCWCIHNLPSQLRPITSRRVFVFLAVHEQWPSYCKQSVCIHDTRCMQMDDLDANIIIDPRHITVIDGPPLSTADATCVVKAGVYHKPPAIHKQPVAIKMINVGAGRTSHMCDASGRRLRASW